MSVRIGRRHILGAVSLLLAALTSFTTARSTLAAPVMDSPTSVTARASNASATIRWVAPIDTGGELVTGYVVTSQPGGQTCTTTGSPAPTTCVVSGLTNGVAYTFSVVASTSSATSPASSASSAVTPIAGTTGTNFLAANGAQVKWGSDYIWASDPPSYRSAWPTYIYNYSSWSSATPGSTVVTAQEVNDPQSTSAGSCVDSSRYWQWPQLLCDIAPGTNDPNYVSKVNGNLGFTIDSVNDTSAFVVVDLGSVRNFTTLRIFQMFSDGKVTEAAIYRHPSVGATWPTVSDAGWIEVKRSKIGAGKENIDSSVTCPTILDFSATTSRYVMFNFKNRGEFGDPSWIEVGGAKLFYETTEPIPASSCPPEPPTNASAVPGNASATVSWSPAVGVVSTYSIQYSSDNGVNWTTATTSPATISSTANTALVTGLNNGASYVFRVQAVNAAGSSPYSSQTASAVSPTSGLPNPPQSVTATPLSFSVLVSWTAVSGATSYTVTSFPGGKTCTATAPDTSCIVANLTAGLNYTFSVATSNSTATSGQSVASASVVPVAEVAPGAPVKPTTSVSGTSVTVTVAAGQSGGTPASYVVTASPGGLTCTVSGASGSCTISGLTPGQSYTFTSVATNAGGSGASSIASDAVSIAASSTPTQGSVTTPTTQVPAANPTVSDVSSPTTQAPSSSGTQKSSSVVNSRLPQTGSSNSLLVLSWLVLAVGAFCVIFNRRRVRN